MSKLHRSISLFLIVSGFILSGCAGKERREQADTGGGRILIAYFSWANNTVVEYPDLENVEAMSSASILVPGNTGLLAGRIQEITGGDLFPIVVTEPYSSDFQECAARAGEELAANARPALKESVNNIDSYDIVFLGYPVWANTCPMAVFSFIDENDLSGKTILLFSALGGGSMEKSVSDIIAALPGDCTIMENVFAAPRADFAAAQDNIKTWLTELNIDFTPLPASR